MVLEQTISSLEFFTCSRLVSLGWRPESLPHHPYEDVKVAYLAVYHCLGVVTNVRHRMGLPSHSVQLQSKRAGENAMNFRDNERGYVAFVRNISG
jgi:hypothetical protein